MPLAALTPVLNDLLHQRDTESMSNPRNQFLQQSTISSNDSSETKEYLCKDSAGGLSASIANPSSSSSSLCIDDVSS